MKNWFVKGNPLQRKVHTQSVSRDNRTLAQIKADVYAQGDLLVAKLFLQHPTWGVRKVAEHLGWGYRNVRDCARRLGIRK